MNTLIRILLLYVICCFPLESMAQDHHSEGHADYSSWASKKTSNCCNNQDCGQLKDAEWKEDAEGTHVLILGKWCPVLSEHWITKGNSPDWEHAHACVNKNVNFIPVDVCERLLCFTPIPKV